MSSTAISVENLSKAYRLGVRDEVPDTFASALVGAVRSPLRNLKRLQRLTRFDKDDESADTLWALRDVSFEIAEGDVVGVIGRNGAGKSTLLKILSRITEPTSGRAVIRGRVSSLLEVGTGFHPDLTGRENVYMNGTILGMRKREIDRKFDEIVEFSGIEKFLDTPVKRYSSGMSVRLAFAVAAHLEPEILIIDEVLAVGDAEFQKKCLGKMRDVAASGRTVLFVSHNMGAVVSLCDRAIVLSSGQVILDSTPQEAVSTYFTNLATGESSIDLTQAERDVSKVRLLTRIQSRSIADGRLTNVIPTMSGLEFEVAYQHTEILRDPAIGLMFESSQGVRVFTVQSRQQHGSVACLSDAGVVTCSIPAVPLVPGRYYVTIFCMLDRLVVERFPQVMSIDVVEADVYGTGRIPTAEHAVVLVDANWSFSKGQTTEPVGVLGASL